MKPTATRRDNFSVLAMDPSPWLMNTPAAAHTGVTMSLLLSIYAVARVFQVLPGRLPMVAVVALHVLPLLVFALIHGAMSYRLHGILIFFAICLIIGNAFENLGIATGFPFGRYYFTDAMGLSSRVAGSPPRLCDSCG